MDFVPKYKNNYVSQYGGASQYDGATYYADYPIVSGERYIYNREHVVKIVSVCFFGDKPPIYTLETVGSLSPTKINVLQSAGLSLFKTLFILSDKQRILLPSTKVSVKYMNGKEQIIRKGKIRRIRNNPDTELYHVDFDEGANDMTVPRDAITVL